MEPEREIATLNGGRDEPIYATIHAVLRDHIERGKLPPGLVLGQANVARAFNVSRVPAGIALSRLRDDGLVSTFEGRGYVVPGAKPFRTELFEAGLVVPPEVVNPSVTRREQIYSDVEHAVAACLAYGRFMLNETALAQHFDVSRTIAHEVLTQLERLGIIEQDSNNRWYAGPMTSDDLEHHFEMRWILEPQALRHAYRWLDKNEISARLDRIETARKHEMLPLDREQLEADLHIHTLAPCPNSLLLHAVRRSQRILIATHSAFENYQHGGEITQMSEEHVMVYKALLNDDIDLACSILEAHLRRALNPNLEILNRLEALPEALRLPYLVQVR
ncbi:GntR family transcriptional regulator [Rhizobium sp. LjRoot254]|uniref:GntR family transcriptional regulator n=1 Tax=Rhizobium sp. LjRoot254 TaxID=3342297 RepID=UPI003ECD004A